METYLFMLIKYDLLMEEETRAITQERAILQRVALKLAVTDSGGNRITNRAKFLGMKPCEAWKVASEGRVGVGCAMVQKP